MSSELDKFTFTTTYRQDYGKRPSFTGVDPTVPKGKVDCRAKAYVGEATGRPYEKPGPTCPCGPNQRAAGSAGMMATTQGKLPCAGATRLPNLNKEELAEMMYKAAETGNIKAGCATCGNKPDVTSQFPATGKIQRHATEPVPCPGKKYRPVPIGQFGGLYEGPLNRETVEPIRVNDQAMPYTFDKPCVCPPAKPEGGPQDYGPAWIRERAGEESIGMRMTGGRRMTIDPDVQNLVNPDVPIARVSCAPEADPSKFDQPNTFMRKLYEKYPYLYQILRDTPPEELIARVFKDRFLSTYQVDYLHMGVGKESYPKGGEKMNEKFYSPDGEPEPIMIPGASYRPSKKTDFGRKKPEQKTPEYGGAWKEENDDEANALSVKKEERISEYMASISKLGGEIISEKLYLLEASNRAAAAAGKNIL